MERLAHDLSIKIKEMVIKAIVYNVYKKKNLNNKILNNKGMILGINLTIKIIFTQQIRGIEIRNFLDNMINNKKMKFILIIRNHRNIIQSNWAAMNMTDKSN